MKKREIRLEKIKRASFMRWMGCLLLVAVCLGMEARCNVIAGLANVSVKLTFKNNHICRPMGIISGGGTHLVIQILLPLMKSAVQTHKAHSRRMVPPLLNTLPVVSRN